MDEPMQPRRVLDHHRRRLLEHFEQHLDSPHFTTGVAWGLYALERVDRALRGITDRGELGLNDSPRSPFEARRAGRPAGERASITCPLCGRTSWHPDDVANGYCGACHAFTTPLSTGVPGARKDPA